MPLNNIMNTPLGVKHADLKRYSGESVYKSLCPVEGCDGLLLVTRHWASGRLLPRDYCTYCGQQVIYLDIDQMRKELR